MKYTIEKSLKDFEFWSGAVSRAEVLTDEQFDTLEAIMEDSCEEWSDGSINDFFWFEEDTIAEWLGFNSWEALERHKNGEDEEDEPTDDEKENLIYYIKKRIRDDEEALKDVEAQEEADEECIDGLEAEITTLWNLLDDEDDFAEAASLYHEKLKENEYASDAADDVIWNYI